MPKMGKDDTFSWQMMSNMLDEKLGIMLDEKLADVARKSDLSEIMTELMEVKAENAKLRDIVSNLSARLERIDRKTRLSSVVVNGLSSGDSTEAKLEFNKLCTEVLHVNVSVTSCVKLSRRSFIFNLESSTMTQNLLSSRSKLKGRSVYIQKDFTANEQNVRFKLRKISNCIKEKNKSIKVRLGDVCMYVNDKKFTWHNNKVMANSVSDSDFIKKLFNECNIIDEVDINIKSNYYNSQ